MLLVEREADFQRHLPVGNLAFFDVAARFAHLKPAHVANGFPGARQRVFHGVVKRIRRRTNQLDFFVNVISHDLILT